MKSTVVIDKEKLAEIIRYASEEIMKKDDGVSRDTIAAHIAEKMKEVLADDH